MRSIGVARIRSGRHREGTATSRTVQQRQRIAENRRDAQSKGEASLGLGTQW
nr:MAG TPA: hypothetical protein [Caudoviricetes sp.]